MTTLAETGSCSLAQGPAARKKKCPRETEPSAARAPANLAMNPRRGQVAPDADTSGGVPRGGIPVCPGSLTARAKISAQVRGARRTWTRACPLIAEYAGGALLRDRYCLLSMPAVGPGGRASARGAQCLRRLSHVCRPLCRGWDRRVDRRAHVVCAGVARQPEGPDVRAVRDVRRRHAAHVLRTRSAGRHVRENRRHGLSWCRALEAPPGPTRSSPAQKRIYTNR